MSVIILAFRVQGFVVGIRLVVDGAGLSVQGSGYMDEVCGRRFSIQSKMSVLVPYNIAKWVLYLGLEI